MSIWVILFLMAVLSLALSLTFFALTETDGNSITANVGGDVEQCMLKVCQALCVLNVAGNVFSVITADTWTLRLIGIVVCMLAMVCFFVTAPMLSSESILHINFFKEKCKQRTVVNLVESVGALSIVAIMIVAVIMTFAIRGIL